MSQTRRTIFYYYVNKWFTCQTFIIGRRSAK